MLTILTCCVLIVGTSNETRYAERVQQSFAECVLKARSQVDFSLPGRRFFAEQIEDEPRVS